MKQSAHREWWSISGRPRVIFNKSLQGSAPRLGSIRQLHHLGGVGGVKRVALLLKNRCVWSALRWGSVGPEVDALHVSLQLLLSQDGASSD